MDDLLIRSFKNQIIELMNKTSLPTEVKRLVLSEILNETTKLVNNDIMAQIQTLQEQKDKEALANAKPKPKNSPE